VMNVWDVMIVIMNGIMSAGVVGRLTNLPILPVKSQFERVS
jgi:hypothetical protein